MEHSLQTDEEREFKAKVSYASAIGSLTYVMVCTRLDIGHIVGVVNRFMSKLIRKQLNGF